MKNNKKLFSWDFHGTLEEGTEVGFAEILKNLAKEFELKSEIELKEVRRLFGSSIRDYLEHFFPEAKKSTHTKMMGRIPSMQSLDHVRTYLKPAPFAQTVLEKIKEAGHHNIVVSNSSPKHIGKFMDAIELGHLIHKVYAVDRHYSKVKIDPILAKANNIKAYATQFGFTEIIVIGDRKTDVDAGKAAGAITMQVIRKGFPIDKTDADFKIKSLKEVLKLL